MKDESTDELIAGLVKHQEEFNAALEQFVAGVFPERFGWCFEAIYKQATALLEGDYFEILQQYLATIVTSSFEQFDVYSDQFVDGDPKAFEHSSMWLSIYTNRHLFPMSSTQKWSEFFAVNSISMLVNSVSSVKVAASQLLISDDTEPDLQDYGFVSAVQLIQLAQLSRHEEDTDSSNLDTVQLKADQIKSRDARRTVAKRWSKNTNRVLKFDAELDENLVLSKNEQARRFLRALPAELKPKGDNEEAHVRTLVNAHRRHRKKWDIGDN